LKLTGSNSVELELAIYIGLLLLDIGWSVDGVRHVDEDAVGIFGILGTTDDKKGRESIIVWRLQVARRQQLGIVLWRGSAI
jgi:hypothetical protein